MDIETIVTFILVSLLVYFSLDFDKSYSAQVHMAARQPFARFLAGAAVTILAQYNPALAALGLLVVFFWIADVHLLSTLKL